MHICFILHEGQVKFLGRFNSDEELAAASTEAGPWKRVLTEEDLMKLQDSIWIAYAEAIKPLSESLQKQSWLNLARASVLRILGRISLGDLLHLIADYTQDDSDSDGTPYAHPAFYRGEASATAGIILRLRAILDGTDDGSGVLGDERLEEIRRQLLDRVRLNNVMNIPKDKNYPADAVQCDGCGGHGCSDCKDKGWLPAGHPKGRKCERPACNNPIRPNHIAVYCSNECAFNDA